MSAYLFETANKNELMAHEVGSTFAGLYPTGLGRIRAAAEFKKKQLRLLKESTGWEKDPCRLREIVAAVRDLAKMAEIGEMDLASTKLFVEETLRPACMGSGLDAEEIDGLLGMINI